MIAPRGTSVAAAYRGYPWIILPMVARVDPYIVHPLPRAPSFTGRSEELEQMRQFWKGPDKVLALIGMGGAGKTALAQEFLSEVQGGDQPDRLLVWSFYDDPDADAFLRCAYGYLTGSSVSEAKGVGWFHLLKEAFDSNYSILIVLDGLERVQRPSTDATGIYGELEDPLLRGLLVRLATSNGRGKAIVTTRFPLTDIERSRNAKCTFIDINRLSERTSCDLLRRHGLRDGDSVLAPITEQYGRHALTIDLLGGAISRFFDGDLSRVPRITTEGPEEEAQAKRLSTVLGLYDERLCAQERDLMSRLCVFRFGVSLDTLSEIFLQSDNNSVCGSLQGLVPVQLETLLLGLVQAHLVYREDDGRYTVHPAVRDHFYRIFRDTRVVHGAVSAHLLSLGGRPGIGFPKDKPALDLLEELIFHAISAGNLGQALDIYETRLGGNEHLNATLGEYNRTYRILQAFAERPDPGAMYLCLRAFGNFDKALEWRPQNRYIQLLCGELEVLAKDSSDRTSRVARFLQGDEVSLPDRLPDYPICAAYLHLLKGSVEQAEHIARHDIEVSLYRDDIVRNELALVDVARRKGDLATADQRLNGITGWVLNSGSQEHLCYLSLVRARIALDDKRYSNASLSISEGLDIAGECSFKLFEIELLLENARLAFHMDHVDLALEHAGNAYALSTESRVLFYWGALAALARMTEYQSYSKQFDLAKATFGEFQMLNRKLREPRFVELERHLERMVGLSS